MTTHGALACEALVWLFSIAVIALAQEKRRIRSTGLALAYVLSLWLIHWLGAVIYLLPWYSNLDPGLVEIGFRQSAYAALAFAAGVVVLGPGLFRSFGLQMLSNRSAPAPEPTLPVAKSVETTYLLWGLASYLILVPVVGHVPTATALVVAGWNMVVVALALSCWRAWSHQRPLAFLGSLVLVAGLPLLTITRQAYLGPGATALLAVMAFVKMFRIWPRTLVLGMTVVFLYLSLSFYGSYMRDRADLREAVFSGVPISESMGRLYLTISNLQWFNPFDGNDLMQIDDRLNQNELVGLAIDYVESGSEAFAGGETLLQGVLAIIPRALWPDKPVEAGSMDLVSRFTGLSFAEGTSVGIGQVMEFYINFGTLGVLLGFAGLGVTVSVLDFMAWRRLVGGDWQRFALWYMPSLSLLQPGGSLVDITASAGAALVNVLLVNYLLLRFTGVTFTPHSGSRVSSRARESTLRASPRD